MAVNELRVMGRNTQGVKLINLKNNDEIAAIAKVEMDKDVEEGEEVVENNNDISNEENTQFENN